MLICTLRERRREQRYSMQQLADAVGCHKQTIFRIERGLQEPSYSLVKEIEKVLGKEIYQETEQEKGA